MASLQAHHAKEAYVAIASGHATSTPSDKEIVLEVPIYFPSIC